MAKSRNPGSTTSAMNWATRRSGAGARLSWPSLVRRPGDACRFHARHARHPHRFWVTDRDRRHYAHRRTPDGRWFRAADVKDDWCRFYDLLAAVGRNATSLVLPRVRLIFRRFDPGPDGCWTLAVDDSPTKRYGRHVEAANIYHNPTPGAGDGDWLYGHSCVCLAMIFSHPLFEVITLPLKSLFVRSKG